MLIRDIIIGVDAEIARLQLVRKLLAGESGPQEAQEEGSAAKSPKEKTGRVKRVLSAEAKERIAEGQRKRWAAVKKAGKKAAK